MNLGSFVAATAVTLYVYVFDPVAEDRLTRKRHGDYIQNRKWCDNGLCEQVEVLQSEEGNITFFYFNRNLGP